VKPALNRQVFMALATIAWADGDLAVEERDGILRAARGAGFSDEALASLGEAIQTPCDLDSLDLRKLNAADRVFVFATGEWLARLDGVVHDSERDALQKLGAFLMLSERVQKKATQAALEIAKLPSGNKPEHYDLVKLRSLIEERLG